ncbi:MAG: hypothetical protein ACR2J7_01995 [Luteimonas sp.]
MQLAVVLLVIGCTNQAPVMVTKRLPPQPDDIHMLASVSGTLVLEAGCVRLQGDPLPDGRPATRSTPVFPGGYLLRGSHVLGLQGQPVAAIDRHFAGGGGHVSDAALRAMATVDARLLDACAGPYALINPTREEMGWPPPPR